MPEEQPTSVDVDTRRAQKAAGIEDCPTSKHRPPADRALPDISLPCPRRARST